MKRVLTKWDSMAISTSIVIGIGIFRVPSDIARYLPDGGLVILLAWFVGALISGVGALCYAELSARFPENGGDYVFLREGYGKLVAFLYAWTELLIIRTGSIAVSSFLFADYACGFFSLPKTATKLLAIGIVIILSILNFLGLQHIRKLQNVLTLIKVVALLLLILTGFLSGKGDLTRITAIPAQNLDWSFLSAFALALVPILWTYGGWQENTFAGGETSDAARSLPFALIGTVITVGITYILINALYLYMIPTEQMIASPLDRKSVV